MDQQARRVTMAGHDRVIYHDQQEEVGLLLHNSQERICVEPRWSFEH